MRQTHHAGGLSGHAPKEGRSALSFADAQAVRDFYATIPRAVAPDLGRYKVRGVMVAYREIDLLHAAGAPESEGWRYVGMLERRVQLRWQVPARSEAALEVAETALDGAEDVHECELRQARLSGDPVRIARALDACIASDAQLAAVHTERCVRRQREKAERFGGTC